MASIPKRVEDRLISVLKRFQPILVAQRDRDVSEADTVTLVKDLLSDLFAYDKYSEVTSEHAIRSTFCDLAVRIDDKLRLLIEVKAIGMKLSEKHIKQAVDYAANQGVDWVVLTNAAQWMLFRLQFKKPIDSRLVAEFDVTTAEARTEAALEKIYLLTREGLQKGALKEFSERRDAMSRFMLASIICNSEDVLSAIRREVRRVSDLLVPVEAIANALRHDVVKREALEGEEAVEAHRSVTRTARSRAKVSRPETSGQDGAILDTPPIPEPLGDSPQPTA